MPPRLMHNWLFAVVFVVDLFFFLSSIFLFNLHANTLTGSEQMYSFCVFSFMFLCVRVIKSSCSIETARRDAAYRILFASRTQTDAFRLFSQRRSKLPNGKRKAKKKKLNYMRKTNARVVRKKMAKICCVVLSLCLRRNAWNVWPERVAGGWKNMQLNMQMSLSCTYVFCSSFQIIFFFFSSLHSRAITSFTIG